MTAAAKTKKPRKPRRDFPLFPAGNGQWSKKVRGRRHNFGSWADDPKGEAAERRWDAVKADLLAGRKASSAHRMAAADGWMVEDVINKFLATKDGKVSGRHFQDYLRAGKLVNELFGGVCIDDVEPRDFSAVRERIDASYRTPSGQRREIQNVKAIFRYAQNNGLATRVMNFGDDFAPPSAADQRRHKAQQKREQGNRDYTADECRRLLDGAGEALRAMILLGLNCGCSNRDIHQLEWGDVEGDWMTLFRSKTATDRRAWLWPETLAAMESQRKTTYTGPLVFITRFGNPWGSEKKGSDRIAGEFRKLKATVGIERPSFRNLRTTYRTVVDEVGDTPAINLTMAHADNSVVGTHYRERISDERLRRVSEFMRRWLYGDR